MTDCSNDRLASLVYLGQGTFSQPTANSVSVAFALVSGWSILRSLAP